MSATQTPKGQLEKIETCLYRYSSSGTYYAVAKRQGKIIRASLETDRLNVARRKLKDFLADLDRVDVGAGDKPLAQLVDDYLKTLGGAPKTLAKKRYIAERIKTDWPGPLGSKIRIDKIRQGDVRRWLAKFNMKPCNFSAHLWFVRDLFRLAVADRQIPFNPAAEVEAHPREKPIRLTPTYEQFQAIVKDLRSQRCNGHGADLTGDYIEFMGESGLGQAEMAGLERQHVDLEAGCMSLFRVKTRSVFAVPIYPRVRPVLERRLAAIDASPTARVFPFATCKKAMEGVCRRLNLPKYSPRSLRRMFITRALRRGVDVQTVSKWQGHQDGGKLILGTYADIVGEQHSQRMAALLGDDPKNVVPMSETA